MSLRFPVLDLYTCFSNDKVSVLSKPFGNSWDQTTCSSAIYLPPQTELQLLAHEVDTADTPPASCNTGPCSNSTMCEAEGHLASQTYHVAMYTLVLRAQDDVIFIAISLMSSCTLASTHSLLDFTL